REERAYRLTDCGDCDAPQGSGVCGMTEKLTKAAGVFRSHPTRILGFALTIFGSLQLFLPQFQVLLTPKQFAIFTIAVGVIVKALGFINAARANAQSADPPQG